MKKLFLVLLYLVASCELGFAQDRQTQVAEQVQVDVVIDSAYANLVSLPAEEAPEQSPSSPPLATDDPGTPGRGRYEINFISNCDRLTGAGSCENGIDAAFGMGETAQFRVSKALVNSHAEGEANFHGTGATDIGIKWRFYDKNGFKAAVFPSVRFNDATRPMNLDGTFAESEGRSIYLPLILSMDVGKYTVVSNLARRLNADHPDTNSTFTSIAVGRALGPRTRIMSEVASEATQANRRTDVRIGIVRIIFPDSSSRYQTSLFGSIGRSIKSTEDGQVHTSVLFGLSVAKK